MDIEAELSKIALREKESQNYDYLADNYQNSKNALSLIAILYYDLKQGGFPQYIYNSQGIYLSETLEILDKIKAKTIHKYLSNIIEYCINNNDSYHEFLNSNFSESNFKNELWKYSLSYTKEITDILIEIKSYVRKHI